NRGPGEGDSRFNLAGSGQNRHSTIGWWRLSPVRVDQVAKQRVCHPLSVSRTGCLFGNGKEDDRLTDVVTRPVATCSCVSERDDGVSGDGGGGQDGVERVGYRGMHGRALSAEAAQVAFPLPVSGEVSRVVNEAEPRRPGPINPAATEPGGASGSSTSHRTNPTGTVALGCISGTWPAVWVRRRAKHSPHQRSGRGAGS